MQASMVEQLEGPPDEYASGTGRVDDERVPRRHLAQGDVIFAGLLLAV